MILLGGARDAEDLARVDGLRALASELKISVRTGIQYVSVHVWNPRQLVALFAKASVTFMLNVPFSVLQAQLGESVVVVSRSVSV